MKTNTTICMLIACLTGAGFFTPQATAATGTLSGVITAAPALVDLTAGGTLDWIVWGYPDPNSFDRKSGVTSQISDITMTGAGAVRDSDSGFINYTWSDGSTAPFVASENQSIYFEGGESTACSFTVPAGTTPKVLTVYAGAWNATANLQAALSDQSAPPYTGSFDTGSGTGEIRAWRIQFAAGSDGQTLTITANVGPLDGADGGLELGAATLAGPEPRILTPPAPSTNWIGQTQQFSVTADGVPPFHYQWWMEAGGVYEPLTDEGQVSGATTPTLTLTTLTFANATNYYVVVTNLYGNVTSTVAALAVLPITGTMIGAAPPAPPTLNLTAVGTLDWAAWGLNTESDFDQKAGGTNQITNFTLIGPGPNGPFRYTNALAAISWSDGVPDPTGADTTTGVYFNGLNNGYQLTVPADQTKRILTVYAGGWNTTVHFEAALSDLSAPTYVDESLVTFPYGSLMAAYMIEYDAGSPGQTLTINVYSATDGGNVTLMAATLNGPPPLITVQPASQASWVGQNVRLSTSATGWPLLAYQWWQEVNGVYSPLVDGGQFSGATTPTLNIDNLVFGNATNYYVVVTNAYGAVTSSVANLSVLPVTGTLQAVVYTNIASLTGVNLTLEGTLDWANWGLADVTDFNDKASGGGQISNFTLYGPIAYGPTLDNYGDQPYGFSWTDGTPTASASTIGHDTANYVYVGSLNSGFTITVPVDTTKRVLKLHYGGWGCRTRIAATLSDNSAPSFINDAVDDPAGNIAYGVATILFAAGSPGQTLTVTVYDVLDYMGGNVAISAATLAGPEPIIVTQPASQTNWVGLAAQFSVDASGPPIPLFYQWWKQSGGGYVPLADVGQSSGSTTPTLTISNLVFPDATNYYVVVTNAYGSVTSSVVTLTVLPPIGTLAGGVVSLYSPTDGVDPTPTNIFNLTEEGTLDWIKWNSSNNGGNGPFLDAFDRKVGGANQISDTLPYGATNVYYDGFQEGPLFSWSDGAPDAAVVATNWDVCNCGLNNGLQFTVAADTTTKYLRVYAGIFGGGLTCRAALSDSSAPLYVDSSVFNEHDNLSFNVYTIQFAAHSAGQTLTVTLYVNQEGVDGAYTSANLQAASLRSTPFPPVLPPLTLQVSRSGSNLQLTWPYGTLLQATNVTGPWTINTNTSTYTVAPTGLQMFYRVQE